MEGTIIKDVRSVRYLGNWYMKLDPEYRDVVENFMDNHYKENGNDEQSLREECDAILLRRDVLGTLNYDQKNKLVKSIALLNKQNSPYYLTSDVKSFFDDFPQFKTRMKKCFAQIYGYKKNEIYIGGIYGKEPIDKRIKLVFGNVSRQNYIDLGRIEIILGDLSLGSREDEQGIFKIKYLKEIAGRLYVRESKSLFEFDSLTRIGGYCWNDSPIKADKLREVNGVTSKDSIDNWEDIRELNAWDVDDDLKLKILKKLRKVECLDLRGCSITNLGNIEYVKILKVSGGQIIDLGDTIVEKIFVEGIEMSSKQYKAYCAALRDIDWFNLRKYKKIKLK